MHSNVAGGLSEAVHDAAQRGFVDAQHARQAVLPDARGVHPQLEVRIDVSVQGHGSLSFSVALQRPVGAGKAVTAHKRMQSPCQSF